MQDFYCCSTRLLNVTKIFLITIYSLHHCFISEPYLTLGVLYTNIWHHSVALLSVTSHINNIIHCAIHFSVFPRVMDHIFSAVRWITSSTLNVVSLSANQTSTVANIHLIWFRSLWYSGPQDGVLIFGQDTISFICPVQQLMDFHKLIQICFLMLPKYRIPFSLSRVIIFSLSLLI
jgi:hypothetical protein